MSEITQAAKQENQSQRLVNRDGAICKLISPNNNVITVIGNDEIRNTFEKGCLDQACNIADAPGVDKVVLSADCHSGFGAPVGCIFSSRDYIYPPAVGPDVKCSMSFLQLNIPDNEIKSKDLRKQLITALEERIPMGTGSRQAPKARRIDIQLLKRIPNEGATPDLLAELGIPATWSALCEDSSHGNPAELEERLGELFRKYPPFVEKLYQIGSVGGGNHFESCDIVQIQPGMEDIAKTFGLIDGNIGFLNHFGSRGFGYYLTEGGKGGNPGWFRFMEEHFNKWRIPFPGGDKHNVYMPYDSPEGKLYLNDMYLGANFATVNHLLTCTYVLEAFKEVLGDSVDGKLVYYIAHNIIRREVVESNDRKDVPMWVHRKGATRALPAGHHELKGTNFFTTGHPILLPGNPIDGSTIMVGQRGSAKALNSVNHGAGRSMSRMRAKQTFSQRDVNAHFEAADIVTNCRNYPIDECSGSYKPYKAVIDSVVEAGLAKTVAVLKTRFLLKDGDQSAEGSA